MNRTTLAVRALSEIGRTERLRFAYLAMTGKLENAVRDHLAHWIHVRHGEAVVVGRDVGPGKIQLQGSGLSSARFDLAVISRSTSKIELCEAKQFYTFDFREGRTCLVNELHQQIAADAKRLMVARLPGGTLETHLLFLVCHVAGISPEPEYKWIEKYDISRKSTLPDRSDEILLGFKVDDAFTDWEFIASDKLELGECFGYSVTLLPIVGSRRS
jgi:hypothetical protein